MKQDSVQPGVEPVRLPQARQVSPAPNERLLDGLFGAVVVPQDQAGNPIEMVDDASHEDVVRIPVPVPRQPRQLGVPHQVPHVPADRPIGVVAVLAGFTSERVQR
jgi:hypothetical protein